MLFAIDAVPVSGGVYGEGEGRVLLDDLLCQGDEENLLDCSRYSGGTHSCDHSQDAGIRCEGESQLISRSVQSWIKILFL